MALTKVQPGLLEATGTASSSTFLRGDGAWSTTIASGTAVTASGTSVDFTGIPSTAKRITVMLSEVSTNGTSAIICRIGTGGTVTATGYTGNILTLTNTSAVNVQDSTGSLVISNTASAANVVVSTIVWTKINGNTWVGTSSSRTATTISTIGNSTVTLSGDLDIVRVTMTNGTDTFDAGTINILYE